jgi:glycosyltransferase involved in cell wall biosynthesis
MSEFADVVEVARPDDFPAAIRAAHEADTPERGEARRRFVSNYSWESIADRLVGALEGAVAAQQQSRER